VIETYNGIIKNDICIISKTIWHSTKTRSGAFLRANKGEIQTERVIFLSGFTYKEQYAVVVICKDEKEQETVYNRLKNEGHKVKVVAV
jgi:predicted 3-demethylubiquinone-9 3-methyltransferase (glyoxalase superfamily)